MGCRAEAKVFVGPSGPTLAPPLLIMALLKRLDEIWLALRSAEAEAMRPDPILGSRRP